MMPRPSRGHTVAHLDLQDIRGAIFDLDGVLTDTASLHRRAWKQTFDAAFANEKMPVAPFTDDDYLKLVDGRLRLDGARAVLVSRGLDTDELELRAAEIATAKDNRYRQLLEQLGPSPYASSIAFLRELRSRGIRIAIATGSVHAREVLQRAGLEGDVDVLVDGRVAEAEALAGKPDPAVYREAAGRLGESTAQCIAIDDALSGVASAHASGCVVIGLDRLGREEDFRRAGSDLVLADLDRVELSRSRLSNDPYLLIQADVDDDREGVRESLFTLGNGYLATRGARSYVNDDQHHYPGTYFAGVFDRLHGAAQGHAVDEDAIVNAPNWLFLSFAMAEGSWLGSSQVNVETSGAILDLKAGLLVRRFRVHDGERTCSVIERRFVSMANPHLVGLQTSIVAENWSGQLQIRAGIDGVVKADETVEEQLLGARRTKLVTRLATPNESQLSVRTIQSDIVLAEASRAKLATVNPRTQVRATPYRDDTRVAQEFALTISEGQRVICEKVVALYTSRDAAISSPSSAARQAARRAPDFESLLVAHRRAWLHIWQRSGVAVRDETEAIQRLVNLHLFHVLQVASPHVVDRDIGLGARGLHGEGYLGHVFWDELFVLPVVTRRFPSVTRSILSYRWRRLDAARAAATAAGHRGAMYPWQSASDGRDETPRSLFNPRSGHWIQDRSRLQRHVGLAIAYNFWQYFETTGDEQHLFEVGAETILEIARFFADIAEFDASLGRYHIRGVMGPDEFHDGYPWRHEPGVDDNAYTNLMTAWLLGHCATIVELVRNSGRDELLERLGLGADDFERFEEISRRLYVPFMGRVLAQFDGYDQLETFDLDRYHERYGDLARLDLILEAEGDSVQRYQVGKQPDALMPLFLFSAEELRDVLRRLGYHLDADAIRDTIDFYRHRVTHGSSLSRVVHAWIDARRNRSSSWRYLLEALEADVLDLNKGTTREGIHLGAMAGTIDIFERCYPGLEFRSDTLWLNPSLPNELRSIDFHTEYRGHLLAIEITNETVTITSPQRPDLPVPIFIRDRPLVVGAGEQTVVHNRQAKITESTSSSAISP